MFTDSLYNNVGAMFTDSLYNNVGAMFTDSLYNNVGGVNITYRRDGQLFNSKGFPIPTRGKVANI
jgi:hypothetical protein